MYKPQKLHPISYINGLIAVIKQNFFVIIVFIFVGSKNFDYGNPSSYIVPGIFTAFFLWSFISQILKVYSTRYWIENNRFIVTSGIFNKKRKELNIRRIQSVDTAQSLINQIVGGVELQIKTPSDGINLKIISKKQSEFIEQEIDHLQKSLNKDGIQNQDEQTEISQNNGQASNTTHVDNDARSEVTSLVKPTYLYHMPFKQLLMMAMTSGAIGVALATLTPIFSGLSDAIPWGKFGEKIGSIVQSATVLALIIIMFFLIVSYIIGTIVTLIKYYGYKVTQVTHQLKIEYGLFNKKKITVPTDRVQAVVERQSLLRKLFGYTSIYFIVTSDFKNSDTPSEAQQDGNVLILPFIKRDEAYKILKPLVPEMNFNTVTKGMPWKGFHRHFLVPSIFFIAIAISIYYFWRHPFWIFGITLIIILLLVGQALLYTLNSGLKVNHEEAAMQIVNLYGKKLYYFKQDKVIGFECMQHPLLERSNLATFTFLLAKGAVSQSIKLRYAYYPKVKELQDWYVKGGYHE